MHGTQNPLATALGTYSPRHYLVAVFDDPARAATALHALHEAGFADASAAICPGQQFLVNWTDFAKHRGPLARLVDLYPSEEHAALEDYLAEAAQGASFVSIHLTEHQDITRVRDVLKPLGGHAMRYYGDLTITDL
jgi:hypothetical protein